MLPGSTIIYPVRRRVEHAAIQVAQAKYDLMGLVRLAGVSPRIACRRQDSGSRHEAGSRGVTSFAQEVRLASFLNLAYFGVEFAVALHIGSVSLFADSVDFLEDASVNFLISIALAWSGRARARVGMALAIILLVPGLATLWTAGHKVLMPIPPAPVPLTLTGLGALAINLGCAVMLARFKHHSGSLSRAAFLSARNDVLANIAIMAAGGLTILIPSAWPDLTVGVGIAIMNLDAAREVFAAAKTEHGALP